MVLCKSYSWLLCQLADLCDLLGEETLHELLKADWGELPEEESLSCICFRN
jgi:hypothetical protein